MKDLTSPKIKLRRLAVYLKYSFPLICSAFVWLFCSLKIWRFSRSDETERVFQSLFGIVSTAFTSSSKILEAKGTAEEDVLLAKSLIPSVWVFWIVLLLVTILSLVLFCFTLAAFSKDPLSRECNRVKVRFKALFPGQFVHFLLPLFSMVPLFEPYYIRGRFEKYYAVSGISEGGMGQEYTYYTYSVASRGPNPIVVLAILVIAALAVFLVAIPYQRSQKLDMYTYFDPEPEPEKPRVRQRK